MAAKKKKKATNTKALKGKQDARRRSKLAKASKDSAAGIKGKKWADLSASDKEDLLKALALRRGMIEPD